MTKKCKCGLELVFKKTPEFTHYGKLECPKHGFVKWQPGPKSKGKRKVGFSPSEVVYFRMKIRTPFCFFCLRKREELGINETLEVDHIQELSKGGEDKIENCQVLCSACHKLKNWARLYMNWHMTGVKNDTETTS